MNSTLFFPMCWFVGVLSLFIIPFLSKPSLAEDPTGITIKSFGGFYWAVKDSSLLTDDNRTLDVPEGTMFIKIRDTEKGPYAAILEGHSIPATGYISQLDIKPGPEAMNHFETEMKNPEKRMRASFAVGQIAYYLWAMKRTFPAMRVYEAERFFKPAIEAEYRLGDIYSYYERLAYFNGDVNASIVWGTKAIQYRPDDPILYLSRAECYIKERENEKAMADVRRARELFPENENSLVDYHGFKKLLEYLEEKAGS